MLVSSVDPVARDDDAGEEDAPPGRGSFLVKVGGRPGIPVHVALTGVEQDLNDTNLGTTSIYLQGIDPEEIIATVHMRRAPMISGSAGLRL